MRGCEFEIAWTEGPLIGSCPSNGLPSPSSNFQTRRVWLLWDMSKRVVHEGQNRITIHDGGMIRWIGHQGAMVGASSAAAIL